MEDGTLWGAIVTAWVVIATVPYLYASLLSFAGEEAAVNRITDHLGTPWVLAFSGLMALWLLEAHVHFAILYTCMALLAAIGWATLSWVQRQKAKAVSTPRSQSQDMAGGEQMLLSKAQRYILITSAALVSIVLIAQIEEEGLRDSPWMIGLLVVAGLLLLAFAPSRK